MKHFFFIFILALSYQVSAQVTISGTIVDGSSKETLISAHCMDRISEKSTTSNNQGFYSLTLPKGEVSLQVQYVGYDMAKLDFYLKGDTSIDFSLIPKNELINEVKVVAEIPIHEQTLLGKNVVTVEAIENGASSFGEPDLMKAVTALPGISPGREGRSNFYVRGGDRGQNLILLDGAKLYNTSHLGGFVSLFNTDAIKQVDVYKGGFPARYGGRASSVIDIYTRDGDRNKLKGKLNLGLLTSSVLAEGPVGKKATFLVAGRTTYYDLFSFPQSLRMRKYAFASLFTFRFYDINAKFSYFINPKNKIFVNYFNGIDHYITKQRDGSQFNSSSNYDILNNSISIGHFASIAPKLFLRNSATYSKYSNELYRSDVVKDDGIKTVNTDFSMSEIIEYNLQSKLEYYINNHHAIKTGLEYSHYQLNPGRKYTYQSESNTGLEIDTTLGYTSSLDANEISCFVEDEIQVNKQFFINLGLRQVFFLSEGKNYYRTEPRVSMRLMVNNNLSIKANYTIMNQFNHVVINNYGFFEKEIWLASTKEIPPQHSQQVSAGMFLTIPAAKLQFSTEVYYKKMNYLLEYKVPVAEDIVASDINENIIKNGKGEAYGAEFQLKYQNDFFSAELAYVLSWNYRQFVELNGGNKYPFIYDRRHDFTFLVSSHLGKSYTVNTNFVFSTGIPCTLPLGYVKNNDYMYGYYAYMGINNSRMPNYHRLDLSIVKRGQTKKGREKEWKLNVFNVYARKNPVIIYYDRKTDKVFGKSMFSIVPTISYSIKF
ncbi:MAG: TonB-dependent receptor plug domain-containing protein [Prolixibacteraceae bacterium]